MTWLTYLLASIGGAVLIPVFWVIADAVRYAIGRTIFRVRVTSTDAIKKRPFKFAMWALFIWPWLGFVEGLFNPCSACSCGQYRWEPPFKYSGFKNAD